MRKMLLSLFALLILAGCTVAKAPTSSEISTPLDEEGYTIYEVDACDLSGDRKPNAKVDVGFGDKFYWAYTNEYSQLVRITADEIFLQDEENEPVTDKGRYCKDEAKVPGTERKDFDEGHGVADSLGGVSNAYNITPQNSTLNRHGDQAYMEDQMRKALQAGKKVTDFEAIITYPSIDTQIPSHYKYTYKIDGELIIDEFDNVDPDSVPVTVPGFSEGDTYIINTNSKKIHKADCEAVGKMSESNKEEYYGDINNLMDQGYEPCGICNPN